MNSCELHALACIASKALHQAFIDNTIKDQYIDPEEIFENLLHTLRHLVLHSNAPLKERLLNLYVYCIQESDKADKELYGTKEWANIQTAVKGFLVELAGFDLESWEKVEITNA